jgi:predicted dehydrogenase
MISKANLDAVSVATPDFLHREPAILAMEAGLDVLVEKPMATTVEDAKAIADAARKSGSMLMVDFHNRWSPPLMALKRSIDSGEMGSPAFVQARLNDTIFVPTRMLGWSARSNVLWFLGSHLVDLCRWLLGSDPRRAFSVCGSGVLSGMGIQTPDFYQSLIEFRSGSVASLENCWILPETHPAVYDFQLEFVGSEGSYTVNASHSNMAEKYSKLKRENPDLLFSLDLHGRRMGFGLASLWHFVDCALDGKTPFVTAEDGIWATRTICSLLESSRTGIFVTIPQD